MAQKYVSEAVIRRLPRYYRKLCELDAQGIERISSLELSREMELNASQIRRDFNCFGGFGQQGYGYQVKKLKQELWKILGLDKSYNAVIVGAGNIGRALINYTGFAEEGFHIKAIFDINPEIIGKQVEGNTVLSIFDFNEYVQEHAINMGIICTPAEVAQDVCDMFVENGIHAVWNFAPSELKGPEEMTIENMHLSDSLYILAYRMNEACEG
ncbi:redox-sensing transcriptional repressor Rex [Eubacteriales bacterium OttesenSCG-928-M02]|nr:redox-sensing transcriptional repressor Rex [Eubacteriales bacterium OttesenSCG-928-M02]